MRIIPFNRTESNPADTMSAKYERELSIEWFLQNRDWYCKEGCFTLSNSFGGITFSMNFETITVVVIFAYKI